MTRPISRRPLCEPLERRVLLDASGTILFVRGATRSGGFLEGGTAAQRDEQLADVTNASTAAGNHGWATLAGALTDAGFTIEQIFEPKGPTQANVVEGRPIRFETMDLSKYKAIVFGSNNARYERASVDAIETYVRNGGGALFISDANFGSHWRDAPDSDQAFLARFGIIVNQDNGTYPLTRADGHFIVPDHPILAGVNAFDGEGVSPLIVPEPPPPGVIITRLAAARGQTRNNDGSDPAENFAGSLRPVTSQDASLLIANAGRGRVVGYFDRNTFFNLNGAGTDIHKLDNRQLALNLFNWVADDVPPTVTNFDFRPGAPSELRLTFSENLYGSLTRSDVLLRDPFTAEPIPRARWSFIVTESSDHTELLIRIKGAQPAGLYQLQINPNKVYDAALNPISTRIRYNFEHNPDAALSGASLATLAPARAAVGPQESLESAASRVADELFSAAAIVA